MWRDRPRQTRTTAQAPQLFRALRHRNYRLFFTGQSVSLVGTWITRIATGWLVYRLSGSVLLLGLVGFCGQIPTLLLAPASGVLVDRWDRHRVLIVTQAISLLQSLALGVLTITGTITVLQVLVLQIVQGVINAFDTPARQAFVVKMVDDRADLPNAIALNSIMVNASRVVGPSIGGAVIAAVGEGWCFMLDAASYVAVLASLLAMHVARTPPAVHGPWRAQFRAGWQYVSRFAPVRTVLLLLAVVSTMGMPYSVLMPAIAADVLHGGPYALGSLMGASGAGALVASLYLASRRSVVGLGRVIGLAALTFGAALVAFGMSRSFVLSLALMPLVGAGFILTLAGSNTFVQTIVDEHLRGRVMAFYTMAFLGTAPIGSLVAGAVAARLGPAATVMLGGATCVAAAGWFAATVPRLRPLVHRVYTERGILPLDDASART